MMNPHSKVTAADALTLLKVFETYDDSKLSSNADDRKTGGLSHHEMVGRFSLTASQNKLGYLYENQIILFEKLVTKDAMDQLKSELSINPFKILKILSAVPMAS